MSDPSPAIQAALLSALRADAGVAAAFAPNAVRVFEIPPPNVSPPYVTLLSAMVQPELAEGLDLTDTEVTAVAWWLSDPPSLSGAQTLGAAVLAACVGLDTVAGYRVLQARPIRSTYLMDIDGKTGKGAVAVRFSLDLS